MRQKAIELMMTSRETLSTKEFDERYAINRKASIKEKKQPDFVLDICH